MIRQHFDPNNSTSRQRYEGIASKWLVDPDIETCPTAYVSFSPTVPTTVDTRTPSVQYENSSFLSTLIVKVVTSDLMGECSEGSGS